MGEKPLRFLRYFIFSRYDVDLLREDQIYSWFAKNEKLCRYGSAPIEFAKELVAAADVLCKNSDRCRSRGRSGRNRRAVGEEMSEKCAVELDQRPPELSRRW